MKKLIITVMSAVLVMGLLTACQEKEQNSGNVAPAQSVAVVSTDEVYMGSDAGVLAGEILNKMSERLRDGLMELQAMAMEEGTEVIVDFEGAFQAFQLALQEEQERMIMTIDEQFNKILDEIKAEKGISVILEAGSVLSVSEDADITALVMERLNGAGIELDEAAALESADMVVSEFMPAKDDTVEEEAVEEPAPADDTAPADDATETESTESQ